MRWFRAVHRSRAVRSRAVRSGALAASSVLALVLAACTVAPPTPSAPAPVAAPGPDVWHHGQWFTDSVGRVVVFHGVNMVDKYPPYYPSAEGFGPAAVSLVAGAGMNLVRLGVIFAGVMPAPGKVDSAYIGHLVDQVNQLAASHIYVVLDFHQDLYGPYFANGGGDGFPDWAVQTSGKPNDDSFGFPADYLFDPALNAAFDNFWADSPVSGGPGTPFGGGLQDYYDAALQAVAAAFAGYTDVLGYEIMNEPWPGSVYPSCLSLVTGCPAFDVGPYFAFVQRALTAIRSVDRDHIVFYEPTSLFNIGVQTSLTYVGDPGTGFAFHVYPLCTADNGGVFPGSDQVCGPQEESVFANAQAQDSLSGAALLLTEWGNSTSDPYLDHEAALADSSGVSWAYWSFDGTVVPDVGSPPVGSNLNQNVLDDLARPYPRAVAGAPTSWSFDPASKTFRLAYTTAPVGAAFPTGTPHSAGAAFPTGTPHSAGAAFPTGTVTEVSLPALVYPSGYTVMATGAAVVSSPSAPVLELSTEPGASSVQVTVVPAG